MKRARRTLLGVLAGALGVATVGCGGMRVETDFDPAVDFGRYSTFAVLEEAGDQTAPDFWDARIKLAMARALVAKGWRQVDSPDDAQVAVGYQLTTEARSTYRTVNSGWGGYGYGWGGWYGPGFGGGISTSTTTEHQYEVGTLIIAMFDQQQKQMIYTATGSDTIDQRQQSPEEAQEMVDEIVERILRDFPPGNG